MPAAAAARVAPWVEELCKLGHTVSVFTSSSVLDHDGSVVKSYFKVPDNKASLGKRFLQEILLGLDLGIRILMSKKSTRLCFITSPPFFMACICAFFAKFSNIPYVFDVRDRYPRVLSDLGVIKASSFLFKLLDKLESWVYQNALQVTTVTHGLVQELKLRFPHLNIFLVRNGFDEQVFSEHLSNSVKSSAFTVVYHGRLGRFYETEDYIEIMNNVYEMDPSIRFHVVGELPREMQSNLPKNLVFSPAMPLDKLSELLATCHLGICFLRELPAMENAFPAKVYDYIGAGLPVLAAPSGELTRILNDLKLGETFAKVDPSSIAKAIVRIKESPSVWSTMCAEVRKTRSIFGRRKIANTYFTNQLAIQLNES